MLIKKLYFEHHVNWYELARNLESNTVTEELLWEWDDADMSLIYGRVYQMNAHHTPYVLFLNELGLPIDAESHFMNYESNYLAALMAQYPSAVTRAKSKYLTQFILKDDDQVRRKLIDQGLPWGTGE